MKEKLNLYYDEEGDFLELKIGNFHNTYFKNIGDGLFHIIDITTKKITGIAIAGFKTRTKKLEDLKIDLPFTIELTS